MVRASHFLKKTSFPTKIEHFSATKLRNLISHEFHYIIISYFRNKENIHTKYKINKKLKLRALQGFH